MSNQCYCANSGCRCHTNPKFKVTTPFPMGFGPVYCCSSCARHVFHDKDRLDRLDNLPGFE
jgi:hypothetical protein